MITANVEITRHDQGDKGEYHAHVSGSDAVGRLTWVKRADGARVAEHTLVPPEIGGRGIAGGTGKRIGRRCAGERFQDRAAMQLCRGEIRQES